MTIILVILAVIGFLALCGLAGWLIGPIVDIPRIPVPDDTAEAVEPTQAAGGNPL